MKNKNKIKSVFDLWKNIDESTSEPRRSYATLVYYDNCEVTHILTNGRIEVMYETATDYGFKTMVLTLDGEVLFNDGYDDEEVAYLRDFNLRNSKIIEANSRGDFD